MRNSPLNLISTPVAVLNSLGLNLRIGLSSEDPMVGRNPSEDYDAFLSIYSPEGFLLKREHLGKILPDRRRFFDVSTITRGHISGVDHLAVVHRIPSKMLDGGADIEAEIELGINPDYSLFRSLVEYSYPQGGNGAVIYETPHQLNSGAGSSNTFTFTCQTLISETTRPYVALVHHSVNPKYSKVANFEYALHSLSGEMVAIDRVSVGPFGVKLIDISEIIPKSVISRETDPQDGMSAFTFVGVSEDSAILSVIINAAPSLRAVAVEHTHPPQTYLFPLDPTYQRKVKIEAQAGWKSLFDSAKRG